MNSARNKEKAAPAVWNVTTEADDDNGTLVIDDGLRPVLTLNAEGLT